VLLGSDSNLDSEEEEEDGILLDSISDSPVDVGDDERVDDAAFVEEELPLDEGSRFAPELPVALAPSASEDVRSSKWRGIESLL
jgi:hypothetical protein